MKHDMPPFNIQHSTLSGNPVKSNLAKSDPETFKKRYLDKMVNRIKDACAGCAAVALRKGLEIFFGEKISEGELERELVSEVTATFLSRLGKNFKKHQKNVKNPKYDWDMKSANFPDYYFCGMYWERRKAIEGKPVQKTEETIIRESIEELKKDYENCVANVNQLRQEFSLPPIIP
jgi:hypothetical protein